MQSYSVLHDKQTDIKRAEILLNRLLLLKSNNELDYRTLLKNSERPLFENTKESQALLNFFIDCRKKYIAVFNIDIFSTENADSFKEYQQDFMNFWLSFINSVTLEEIKSGSSSTPLFRIKNVNLSKFTRTLDKALDSLADEPLSALHADTKNLDLLGKALKENLNIDHLLNEIDIKRFIDALNQENVLAGLKENVHITRLSEQDIGMALHFAKETHKEADKPYQVHFIINDSIGEKDQGRHWTYLAFEIDPVNKTIKYDYEDSMILSPSKTQQINEIIQKAARYYDVSVVDSSVKTYQAFGDEYKFSKSSSVKGLKVQKDGFRCGDFALQALVRHVKEDHEFAAIESHTNPSALRKYVFKRILKQAKISKDMPGLPKHIETIPSKSKSEESSPTIELTDKAIGLIISAAELSQFKSSTSSGLTNIPIAPKDAKLVSAISEKFETGTSTSEETVKLNIDLNELIKSVEGLSPFDDKPVSLFVIALKKFIIEKKITALEISGWPEDLEGTLLPSLQDMLDGVTTVKNIEFKSKESKKIDHLQEYANAVMARNKLFELFDIKIRHNAEKNPWGLLFQKWIALSKNIHVESRYGYFCFSGQENSENSFNAILLGGIILQDKFLEFCTTNSNAFNAIDQADLSLSHSYDADLKPKFTDALIDSVCRHLSKLPVRSLTILADLNVEEPIKQFKHFLEKVAEQPQFNGHIVIKIDIDALLKFESGPEKVEKLGTLFNKQKQKLLQLIANKNVSCSISFDFLNFNEHESSELIVKNFKGIFQEIGCEFTNELNKNLRKKNAARILGTSDTPKDSDKSTAELEPSTSESSPTKPRNIRKGKLGASDALRDVATEVQVQEQQQQQQQQQQMHLNQSREMPKVFDLCSAEDTCNKKAFFKIGGSFAALLKPHRKIVWQAICGPAELGAPIAYLSYEAANAIISDLSSFKDGLILDNLPPGFFIKETDSGQKVLLYDALNYPENKNQSPLTLRLNRIAPVDVVIRGDASQFGLDKDSTTLPKSVCDESRQLTLPELTKIIKAENEKVGTRVCKDFQELLKTFNGTEHNKLFGILYHGGAVNLEVFLNTLDVLKKSNPVFFQQFKDNVLSLSLDWNEFLFDPNAFRMLQQLSSWSEMDLKWFGYLCSEQSLTHCNLMEIEPDAKKGLPATANWFKVSDVFEAFEYFKSEVQKLCPGIKLPSPELLGSVSMSPVFLERILIILQNSPSPSKQFKELFPEDEHASKESYFHSPDKIKYNQRSKLSLLSSHGAFYASFYEDFRQIWPDVMAFDDSAPLPKDVGEPGQLFKRTFENLFAEAKTPKPSSLPVDDAFKNIEINFYRFLGGCTTLGSKNQYQQAIALMGPDSKIDQSLRQAEALTVYKLMLCILAQTTTHLNSNNTDIEKDFGALIQIIFPELESQKDKITDILKTICNLHDFPLNLHETRLLIDTLMKVEDRKLETTLKQLENLTQHYGTELLKAFISAPPVENTIDNFTLLEALNSFHEDQDCQYKHTLIPLIAKVLKSTAGFESIDRLDTLHQFFEAIKNKELNTLTHILQLLASIDISKKPFENLSDITSFITKVEDCTNAIEISQLFTEAFKTSEGYHFLDNTHQMGKQDISLEKISELILSQVKDIPEHVLNASQKKYFSKNPIDFIEKNRKKLWFKSVYPLFQYQMASILIGTFDANLHIEKNKSEYKSAKTAFDNLFSFNELNGKIIEQVNYCAQCQDEIPKFAQALLLASNTWDNAPQIMEALNVKLSDNKTPALKKHELNSVSNLLQEIYSSYSKTAFPVDLMKAILSHKYFLDSEERTTIAPIILAIVRNKQTDDAVKTAAINLFLNLTGVQKAEGSLIAKLFNLLPKDNNTISIYIINGLSKSTSEISQLSDKLKPLDKLTKALTAQDAPSSFLQIFSEKFAEKPDELFDLLGNIFDPELSKDTQNWLLKIFLANENVTSDTILKLKKVEVTEENLERLYNLLCINPKFPINDYNEEGDLKTFLDTKEKEQYKRDEKTLEAHFDASRAPEVTSSIFNLSGAEQGKPFLYTQQKTLLSHFVFVNSIGCEQGIYHREETPEALIPVMNLTQAEILKLIKSCREKLQDEKTSSEDKITLQLTALALARETLFRTTGKFPYSTQVISVIDAILNGRNIMQQINTGEGKSLTSAMLAFMRWMNGDTVDICTSSNLLAGDFIEEFSSFFSYLQIPHSSSPINAASVSEDYKVGGINCGEVAQMALFHSRMQISGQWKDSEKHSIILDEADHTIFDDATQYRYAINFQSNTSEYNLYDWMYYAINQFIETPQFLSLEADIVCDIRNARNHLIHEAKNDYQKHLVGCLTDNEIDTWLDAALAAKHLKEKTHFVIKEKETEFVMGVETECYKAKPLRVQKNKEGKVTTGLVSEGSQFSKGIQQFLHARLNTALEKEGKEAKFIVTPEISPVTSISSKSFLEYYQNRGPIIGITGTIGNFEEIQELKSKYGFDLHKIPPHRANVCVYHEPVKAKSETDKHKKVLAQVKHRLRQGNRWFWNRDGKPQPIKIFCDDIQEARELYEFVEKEIKKDRNLWSKFTRENDKFNLQLFDGSEAVCSAQPGSKIDYAQWKKAAGRPGCISISTVGAASRGTDIEPVADFSDTPGKHPDGLLTINATTVDSERALRQMQGRSGRSGQPGEVLTFYIDKTPSLLTKFWNSLTGKKAQPKPKPVNETFARNMREIGGDIKQRIFAEFLRFNEMLPQGLRNQALQAWRDLLIELETTWAMIESNLAGDTDEEKLVSVITHMSQQASDLWMQFLTGQKDRLEEAGFSLTATEGKSEISNIAKPEEVFAVFPIDLRDIATSTHWTLLTKPNAQRPLHTLTMESVDVRKVIIDRNPAKLLGQSATDVTAGLRKDITSQDCERIFNDLRQMSTFEKAYRESFNKKIPTNFPKESEESAKLMGELLSVALKEHYRANSASKTNFMYSARLHRNTNQLLHVARESQDTQLSQAVVKALSEHQQWLKSLNKTANPNILFSFATQTKQIIAELDVKVEATDHTEETTEVLIERFCNEYNKNWWKARDRRNLVNELSTAETKDIDAVENAMLKLIEHDLSNNKRTFSKERIIEDSRLFKNLLEIQARAFLLLDEEGKINHQTTFIENLLNKYNEHSLIEGVALKEFKSDNKDNYAVIVQNLHALQSKYGRGSNIKDTNQKYLSQFLIKEMSKLKALYELNLNDKDKREVALYKAMLSAQKDTNAFANNPYANTQMQMGLKNWLTLPEDFDEHYANPEAAKNSLKSMLMSLRYHLQTQLNIEMDDEFDFKANLTLPKDAPHKLSVDIIHRKIGSNGKTIYDLSYIFDSKMHRFVPEFPSAPKVEIGEPAVKTQYKFVHNESPSSGIKKSDSMSDLRTYLEGAIVTHARHLDFQDMKGRSENLKLKLNELKGKLENIKLFIDILNDHKEFIELLYSRESKEYKEAEELIQKTEKESEFQIKLTATIITGIIKNLGTLSESYIEFRKDTKIDQLPETKVGEALSEGIQPIKAY